MVVFIRSNAIVGDPRLEKYVKFLEAQKKPYKIIGWNRTHDKNVAENTVYYMKKSGYSVGGAKAAKDRFTWFWFCIRSLFKMKNVKTIHACDLDGAFPAVLYKIFGHWGVNVVFDVFDWYSDTLANQPKWLRCIFHVMEWMTTKLSRTLIICEPERIKQIPYKVDKKVKVLPNIPSFGNTDFLKEDKTLHFNNNKPTLTYVGGFYYGRFLKELLDVAEQGACNLLIAGYGDKELEERCKQLNESNDNVRYFGKVKYEQGQVIMYNADIIYAMYCKINPNHIFAAPNKYYEAMMLAKPIISTKGTIVGEKIDKHGIGYTIEETTEELLALLASLDKEDIARKGALSHKLWNEEYKDYIEQFMLNEYVNIIKE